MKTCKECGETKPLGEFYRNPPHAKGYRTKCKECLRAWGREYQRRPEVAERRRIAQRKRKRSREQIFAHRLWTWHRVRPERYYRLVEAQGGRCAICNTDEPGGQGRWHVDHDHECCPGQHSCGNCVRGLLCSRCNPMIGMARDDAAVLLAAAEYVTMTRSPVGVDIPDAEVV